MGMQQIFVPPTFNNFYSFSSLDKELVKLAEKTAHERENRVQEKKEHDLRNERITNVSSNNQIKAKQLNEVVSSKQISQNFLV